MRAKEKDGPGHEPEPPTASPTTTKEIHQMSTETIAPAPAAPEGFTPSDPGYFDGPSIQVETAHGCIAVAADWTASQGTRIHLSEVYGPLSPLEALRLAAQLKHLAKKTRS